MELINAKVAESFHLSPPGDAESRNDEYFFRKKNASQWKIWNLIKIQEMSATKIEAERKTRESQK